jgi:hypothetical protein
MSVSSHAQHRGGHEKWKRKREETQNNNDQKKVKQVSDLFEYTIFDLKKPIDLESISESACAYFRKEKNPLAYVYEDVPLVLPVAPAGADQNNNLGKELTREYRQTCKTFTEDVGELIDATLSRCSPNLLRALHTDPATTKAILNNREFGLAIDPVTLLTKVVGLCNGLTSESMREIRRKLEDDAHNLRKNGHYYSDSLEDLHKKWKAIISRWKQLGVVISPEQQVDDFFSSISAKKHPELHDHYEASMRKKPLDTATAVKKEVWEQTYGDVQAATLDEALQQALNYKPEIKYQKIDDHNNVFAMNDLSTIICHLCLKAGHKFSDCRKLPEAQKAIGVQPANKQQGKKAGGKGKDGSGSQNTANATITIDFAFATLLFQQYEDKLKSQNAAKIKASIMAYTETHKGKVVALFDPCSTITCVNHKGIVRDVVECKPLTVTTSMGSYTRVRNKGSNPLLPEDVYFDEDQTINIICAHDMLTDKAKYKVVAYTNGTYDITHIASKHVFKIRWHHKVLIVDITVCLE